MSADRFRVVQRAQIVNSGLPLAVQSLIYANLAMFTAMVLWGASAGMGMAPVLEPPTRLLLFSGGQFWPYVLEGNQWWRCITYAFSHGGLIHLGFNMYVLYQVGPMLERDLGWKTFLFLYTFCAITATSLGLLWHPNTPVVGASGAILGLVGFAISLFHRIGTSLAISQRNFLLQWAAIVLVLGFFIGADNAGHLGGLAGGLLVGWIMPTNSVTRQRWQPLFNILGIVSCTLIVAAHLGLIASWILS